MSASENSLPYPMKGNEYRFVSLLDNQNNFHKAILLRAAIDMSNLEDLDVVCFKAATDEDLAFCKIINFGKWKYVNDKKQKKQKKEHKKATKEIRISLDISDHDLEHKIKQAREFLSKENDVIFSMFLKGRQRGRVKDAIAKMDDVKEICSDLGSENARKNVSPNITLRLSPLVNKKPE